MKRYSMFVAVVMATTMCVTDVMAWCEGMQGQGQSSVSAVSAVVVGRSGQNRVIQRSFFEPAKPEAPPAEVKLGRVSSGAADVFYNTWEVGGSEGTTFGINPSLTFGETGEFTLTVPLHVISPDDVDTIFAVGVDGAYKHQLSGTLDKFSLGLHAHGTGFFGSDDSTSTFGGGPFLSYDYRINPKWIVSAGALLEFTSPDEGDSITELVPGLNVGYSLSDNVALNTYLLHYKNLDSDAGDDAYTDIGADVRWVSGTWSLSGGIKTMTGLDNVDSTEVYLGSEWAF